MRLLIVDDHATVRDGLEHLLSSEFPQAAFRSAASAEEALEILASEPIDIIVLDLNLSGRSGLELVQLFKDSRPSVRILIHTMHGEEQFGLRALRSGADGYLTKDMPVTHLFGAIRRLAEGKRYISPSLAEQLANAVARPGNRPLTDLLSDREYQVLRMLSAGKTPSGIAAELNLSIKTISTYRSRILEKLGLESTADLIRFGIEHNLT